LERDGVLAASGNGCAAGAYALPAGGASQFRRLAVRRCLNDTGAVDISGLTNGGTTAGSIEGGGNVLLGANALTVGGNISRPHFPA
jgi:hypothetical protein